MQHPVDRAYLGDVRDMPPMNPVRRVHYKHPRWIEGCTAMVLAIVGVIFVSILIILALWFAFTLGATRSLAHSDADWIQRGGYKNAIGELCCGKRDCFEIAASDIQETSGGYFIKSIREFVPLSEATPSPDGKYWRCQWGGFRKCFFSPPNSM